MIDFSNRICLIFPEQVEDELLPENCETAPCGSIDITCSKKVVLDQQPKEDSNLWNIAMTAITKHTDVSIYSGIHAYVGIYMTDGSLRVLGRKDLAPEVKMVPHSGALEISVAFEALKPVRL